MEIITLKNSTKYIKNGYVYHKGIETFDQIYLKCHKKKDCKGRAKFVYRTKEFKTFHEHNHPPEPYFIKQLRFKVKLGQRAQEEFLPLNEIFKQEISQLKGSPIAEEISFKSLEKMLSRNRKKEQIFPPIPNSIMEFDQILNDEKWKDKLIYAYGEEKEYFYKTCLHVVDNSSLVVFMSPTFEDFVRMGAPLRLHMDASFNRVKPACGDYVVIHLYIGHTSYPFIHLFMDNQSYDAYCKLMCYLVEFIPQINVEIIVSNNQESIEAANVVFPKCVKSFHPHEESENDNRKMEDLNNVELYHRKLRQQMKMPKPQLAKSLWRFIEVIKLMDYECVCDFYTFRGKKIPNQYPKKTSDKQIQCRPGKSTSWTQTLSVEHEEIDPISENNLKNLYNLTIEHNKKENRPVIGYNIQTMTPIYEVLQNNNLTKSKVPKLEQTTQTLAQTTKTVISPNIPKSQHTKPDEKVVIKRCSSLKNKLSKEKVEIAAKQAVNLLKNIDTKNLDKTNLKSFVINPKHLLERPNSSIIIKVTKLQQDGYQSEDSQIKIKQPELSKYNQPEVTQIIQSEVSQFNNNRPEVTHVKNVQHELSPFIKMKSESQDFHNDFENFDTKLQNVQCSSDDSQSSDKQSSESGDKMVICDVMQVNEDSIDIKEEFIEEYYDDQFDHRYAMTQY